MLTELGIIDKDKQGLYIINSMIIDLRNYKIKDESIIISRSVNNILNLEDY